MESHRVTHTESDSARGRQRDEGLCLLQRYCKGNLDQHVLACLNGTLSLRHVCRVRRCNHDDVNIIRAQCLIWIVEGDGDTVPSSESLGLPHRRAGDDRYICPARPHGTRVHVSDGARPHDANPRGIVHARATEEQAEMKSSVVVV